MALLDKLRELRREYDRLVRDSLKIAKEQRIQYREHLDFDTRQALEEAIVELEAGLKLSEMVDKLSYETKCSHR